MTPEIDALHAAHASLIAEVRALRGEVAELRLAMAGKVERVAAAVDRSARHRASMRKAYETGKTRTGSRGA